MINSRSYRIVIPGLIRNLLFVGLLAMAGCAKDPSFAGASSSFAGSTGESQTVVDIRASILGEAAPTKATWVSFGDKATYGIFTCIHVDTSSPTEFANFKSSLWNVQAQMSGGWKYRNVASYADGALYSEGSASFILMGRSDEKLADLYAYAPWTQTAYAAGPRNIPFDRSTDLMYATENATNANRGKDPASVSTLTADFHFQRVMACLRFEFTLDTPDNTTMSVSLNTIQDNDTAGGAVLYTGGVFDAITGTFVSKTETDKLTGLGSCQVGSGGGAIQFTLVPTEVTADDELTFTFYSSTHMLPPFVLKASQVLHSDGITHGFQAGYKYTFHFTLDNYVRLDGFNIQTWGDPEDLSYHGVI